MQLSSRIIRNAELDEKINIVTKYEAPKVENPLKSIVSNEIISKEYIESYEQLAKTMLEDARVKREELLRSSYEECVKIQEERAKAGYDYGYNEGYRTGIKKAEDEGQKIYEDNINKAKQEAEAIIENANAVLRQAKEDYEAYLLDKNEEIKELVLYFAETLLHKEAETKSCLDALVGDLINEVHNSSTYIIRINPLYEENVKSSVERCKSNSIIKGEIYVLCDESVPKGELVLETDNGKVQTNIDMGIEKLKKIVSGAG